MCYIIEYNEQIFASVLQMTVTIEKKDMTIESVNVWITSDYDFLDAVHTEFFQDLMPFHFSAQFGGIKATNIIIKVALSHRVFSLGSHPQKIVSNHYPQLLNILG